MSSALHKAEAKHAIAFICLSVGMFLIAACLINPGGVYGPWALTFGTCVVLILTSAGALAYFRLQITAAKSEQNPDRLGD